MQFVKETEEGEHRHEGHEADDGHHHHHAGGIDPHIWSSIEGARVVAWNTLNAFIELDKENTEYYWKNYNDLLAEIDKTEAEIKRLLDPLNDRTFIIYHPALTYFAAEFELVQLCIEMDGKEPSPAQLKQLVMTARETPCESRFYPAGVRSEKCRTDCEGNRLPARENQPAGLSLEYGTDSYSESIG